MLLLYLLLLSDYLLRVEVFYQLTLMVVLTVHHFHARGNKVASHRLHLHISHNGRLYVLF